jgi:hypothetical protein
MLPATVATASGSASISTRCSIVSTSSLRLNGAAARAPRRRPAHGLKEVPVLPCPAWP